MTGADIDRKPYLIGKGVFLFLGRRKTDGVMSPIQSAGGFHANLTHCFPTHGIKNTQV